MRKVISRAALVGGGIVALTACSPEQQELVAKIEVGAIHGAKAAGQLYCAVRNEGGSVLVIAAATAAQVPVIVTGMASAAVAAACAASKSGSEPGPLPPGIPPEAVEMVSAPRGA